jgi:hydroxymethylpyrimidine pyrophosphatase-like HAD family hydrolase
VLRQVAEVTHSNVNDCLLEVSAPGVSKATTLARLAASWDIAAAEVMAFGDMPNDLEMLRWAGEGYAMTNSHPEVLASVRLFAPTIHEDGVAQVLERLLETSAP